MNFHNDTSQAPYFSVLGQSLTNSCKSLHAKVVNQLVEKQAVKICL